VNALSKRLGITPSAVSQNLRILRNADLVVGDKQGYFMHYGINRQTMMELQSVVDELFSLLLFGLCARLLHQGFYGI
jgi:DNA-binding transcriptional ArsR family regulator